MNHSQYWITPCQRYTLCLTAASWEQIDYECSQSITIETGGILVGHYSTDTSTVTVTEAIPPPEDSTRGQSWFVRGVAGLQDLLVKRWHSRFRSYYVGEWHYHPAKIVDPSEDDFIQMYSINIDRRYNCREPIMLIVGQIQYDKERPLRVFVFPQNQQHIELGSCSFED